jgi:polar amino acid transport system substrate-binding protein
MPALSWQQKLNFAYLQEPPFCFRDSEGRVAGCDVELAQTILAQIGDMEFAPVEAEFADLLPGLVNGRWTMTTGLFITPARQRQVTFSRPIWALPDGLMVQAGNPRDLTGYASLAADRESILAIVTQQAQHDAALRAGVPPARIRAYPSQDEAARAVANGEAHAYASVAMAHRSYVARHPKLRLAVVSESAEEHSPPYGAFAFPQTETALIAAVNAALATYLGSPPHRALMARYGFTSQDIDRVARAPP